MTLPSEAFQEDSTAPAVKISGSAMTKLEAPTIPEGWHIAYFQVTLRCEEPSQGQAPLEAMGSGTTPEEALSDALVDVQRELEKMEERIAGINRLRRSRKLDLTVEDLFAEELTIEDLFK